MAVTTETPQPGWDVTSPPGNTTRTAQTGFTQPTTVTVPTTGQLWPRGTA